MNLKTTFTLTFLILAGGVFWYLVHLQRPSDRPSATLEVLANEITPEKVNRVQVSRGDRNQVFEKTPSGAWSLPGGWPARPREVREVVDLFTTRLHTRFAPTALEGDNPDLKQYGLDPTQSPVKVVVRSGDQDYQLTLGEMPGASNHFSRPTMLRVNKNPEVITLAPNLIALLDRPLAYYQQRRLFPAAIVKEGETQDHAEQLAAQTLQVESAKGSFTLQKTGAGWELTKPVHDRVDPDKLKGILIGVPDLWAEEFVLQPKNDLEEYGLKKPERTIIATQADGGTVKLSIGKEGRTKTRKVTRPAPPGPPGMPRLPQEEIIHEKYRYAKLENNDQIFEIKADKLDSLFVAADTLRDSQLARFRREDATRLEMDYAGQDIVLVKDKDKWRLRKPLEGEAETAKVNDVLDKLSGLQAKEKDILDPADLQALGLSPAAGTVKVAVEETKGEGDKKTKTAKSFTFLLGKEKEDAGKTKLYVQIEGWPRVNLVEDVVTALLKRPALVYRSRRVLEFGGGDLAKVEIQRGDEKFSLRQDKGVWHLDTPVKTEADAGKTERLAEDLGRLEVVEYVNNAPKSEEFDNVYGLGKPALSATLTFAEADKPARTLLLGKQRGDKQEYFAKLASDPSVFVVRKDVHDLLDQGSLAYRKLQLWQVNVDDVAEVLHQKGAKTYRLKRDGKNWKVVEPFEAGTMAKVVEPMMNELASPLIERYEAHAPKDLKAFGLDQPALKLVLTTAVKPEGEKTKEPIGPRVLLVGKPTAEGAKTRFAKVETDPAVFIIGEKLVAELDRTALDLLDRKLLALDPTAINTVRSEGGETVTLRRDKEIWRVEAPGGKFPGDRDTVEGFLNLWSNVEAASFAAYGPKVDWTAYGLDKPSRTVTVTLPAADGGDSGSAKAEEHTLALGKAVPDKPGSFYARLDNGPGAVVLAPSVAAELNRQPLDFADRNILELKASEVTALERKKGAEDLQVSRRDNRWQLVKPADLRADGPTLDGLVEELSSLRAKRVAAFAPKDLKPFGLDAPEAVVTLRLTTDGKPAKKVLRIGKTVDASNGDRFVQTEGSESVGVIPALLAGRLLAAPLQFRDRNLVKVDNVDRINMERGPRQVVFTKADGTWKMTSPVDVETEQAELADFVKSLERLRADQLVADKPADLKPFGLDKPEVRWRLQSGDKEVLGLLIGSHEKVNGAGKEKDGPRLYAKTTGADLVFLLDPKLSGQTVAEYRGRTVWGPTDTAQVEMLRYLYNRNPFNLEKKDGVWQAVGKPDVKIVAETVSETLDALARLKPERYVVDKDPDLKLFGLEPPELVIEIVAPTGKKALHVGRAEGGSKRYYAKVWEGNHNAVFLISAADANLIVRDLTAFTKPPTKKPEPLSPRLGSPRRPVPKPPQ